MKEHESYRVLNLKPGAELRQIKDAYRRLVKLHHPDLSKDPESGKTLALVVEAYKVLSVRKARKSVIDAAVRRSAPQRRSEPFGQGERSQEPPRRAADTSTTIYELGRMALSGGSASARAFAVQRLGASGKATAWAYLKRALRDREALVAKAAVRACADLRISEARDEFSRLYSEGERSIRIAVVDACADFRDPGFRAIVTMGLKDPDQAVRRAAIKTFARNLK